MLSETMPIYALYALWFADTGLSDGQIATLLIIWSVTGFVAEVPTGVLADRYSRRATLIAAGVLQAAGFATWAAASTFTGFAVGFVLWGISGSLMSGAFEALLFDGLAEVGEQAGYRRLLATVTSTGLLAQLPAGLAATVLFAVGGYELAGWVSVGVSLAAAVVATRFREPARRFSVDDSSVDDTSVDTVAAGSVVAVGEPAAVVQDAAAEAGAPESFRGIVAGLWVVARTPAVLLLVVAVALTGGLDALEEYFSLMARDWGVATLVIPLILIGMPVVGASGAALAGSGSARTPGALRLALSTAGVLLAGAALLRLPVGLAAVAVYYGLTQFVAVAVDVRLQHAISSRSRATVTSVASLLTEVAAVLVYAAWAVGGLLSVAVGVLALGVLLPRLLRLGAAAPRASG